MSDTLSIPQSLPQSVAKRFWAKVQKTDTCWLWNAAKNQKGYGVFTIDKNALKVHRIAYTILVGPIPEGLQIDHLCKVRHCCNPAHMEPVTCQVNLLRGNTIAARKARQTHCKRGHEFTPDNTYKATNGTRKCRTCIRLHQRKRKP